MNCFDPSVLKIITTFRCRWVFKKKYLDENWENVGILKRLQKRSAFSVYLKYLLRSRPGFTLTSSTIFDSLVQKNIYITRGRIGITRRRKQKAYPCVEKIIYIFCGSFYYCDSLAYGVGVMWKISNKLINYLLIGFYFIPCDYYCDFINDVQIWHQNKNSGKK